MDSKQFISRIKKGAAAGVVFHPGASLAAEIAGNEAKISAGQRMVAANKQTLQSIATRYKNLGDASKIATAKAAALKAPITVGTGAGLAAIGGAAAAGAHAVHKAKQGFDKDIAAQNDSGQKAYDLQMKLIKANREKKVK